MKTTKEHMKKLVSMVVVFGLITSQVACAGKTTKISAPLDQVKFEKHYNYSVKMKTGEQTNAITGDQIQAKKDELLLNSSAQSKSLMSQDIQYVNGESTVRNGSYALQGLGVGAGVGFILGGLLGQAFVRGFCIDGGGPEGCDRDAGDILGGIFFFGGITGAATGLLGLGIGALMPKHDKVQITPIVSPTAQGGVDAGVNVGFKF
ncbi:MAG: hypothetical protein IT286_03240 [Proteobacteria bacterium]|jgi:hypothetical protein|nr:hypothetical protein [Pseudomonadota bacterium]